MICIPVLAVFGKNLVSGLPRRPARSRARTTPGPYHGGSGPYHGGSGTGGPGRPSGRRPARSRPRTTPGPCHGWFGHRGPWPPIRPPAAAGPKSARTQFKQRNQRFPYRFWLFLAKTWSPAFRGGRLEVAPGRPGGHIAGVRGHITGVRAPGALAARPAGGRLEGAPGRPRGHITGVRGHIAEVRKPGALAAHPAFRSGRPEVSPDPV